MNCCNCKTDCTGLAILASVVTGIIAAFLTVSGILTLPTIFLWALFTVAVVSLGLLFTISALSGVRTIECICNPLRLLLAGILGTILTAVILLIVDISTASVVGAIITGLLILFFSLIVTVTACIINCITNCGA